MPFSYITLYDVRFIVVQLVVGFILVLKIIFERKIVLRDGSIYCFSFVLLITAIYALITGAYESLLSLISFYFILYCSYLITYMGGVKRVEYNKNLYVVACVFIAVGVYVQWFLEIFFGISIFRNILFGGGRHAYSFIWEDFSFASLVVVSCIPIVLSMYGRKLAIAISFLLITATIVTSARTGIVAILVFTILKFILLSLKMLKTGKMRAHYFAIVIVSPVVLFVLFVGLPFFTGRELTIASSGRLDGFLVGLDFFRDNFWFGAFLDKLYYGQNIAIIPHNLFLYPLIMGGVVYFSFFMAFLVVALYLARSSDGDISQSIYLCLLGFQFIPSFFSAYFFAMLLGMAMASSKINQKESRIR
ncbi:MAG: hypothetical protein KUL77_09375 [Thermomonas sp.]|nr:hypothetical protein [Thermomonas sp.]